MSGKYRGCPASAIRGSSWQYQKRMDESKSYILHEIRHCISLMICQTNSVLLKLCTTTYDHLSLPKSYVSSAFRHTINHSWVFSKEHVCRGLLPASRLEICRKRHCIEYPWRGNTTNCNGGGLRCVALETGISLMPTVRVKRQGCPKLPYPTLRTKIYLHTPSFWR